MRIGVCGTQCVGKSTMINDFIKQWPNYKIAGNTYRDKAKANKNIKLNKEGNEESQIVIRNAIIDDLQKYDRKKDNIIHDRTILDYLVYSIWLNANGKVDDLFIEKQIPIIKNTLPYYDIIFFIPIVENYDIPIVPSVDGQRELDPIYRTEIDNIFKAIARDYWSKDKRIFFPNEDCCSLIDIWGTPEERIEMIKLYINENGSYYGEEDSLIKDI